MKNEGILTMSFTIYDTLAKQKLPFQPIDPPNVRMYNCGPTVYSYAHIGNLRAYVFADLLRRWLEVSGYTVNQVMNITDVDDKTIRDSQESGLDLEKFTSGYIDAFFEDLQKMNILKAHTYPRATMHIEEMVSMIWSLLGKGFAYKTEDGSIYFRVSAFPEYGLLSGKNIADLRVGDRVSNDEYESKDDVRDFALWKAWTPEDGDVYWETALGKGRPGWHIECSAMSMKYLGNHFDIHTGGVDNIFPHHENEIAQSRCSTGEGFAEHWMHCEYLLVDGKKMSKSLGNFYTLRDLVDKGFTPRSIRYVLASTHYRSQLNFTFESVQAADHALERIDDFRESWDRFPDGDPVPETEEVIRKADEAFTAAMNDDLNVSRANAALFNLIREINSLASESKTTVGNTTALLDFWKKAERTLGYVFPLNQVPK